MRLAAWIGAAVMAGVSAPGAGQGNEVRVSAPNRDYAEVPVRFQIDAPKDFAGVALMKGSVPVPVQSRLLGTGKAEVCWIERGLKKGETRTYRMAFEKVGRPAPPSGVIVDRSGLNLDIRIDNQLFTRYDSTTGPNKPYFYPIFAQGGKRMARGYPLENLPKEEKDHPHHRGLWFTHGEVNGADFWSEGPKAGKTVTTKVEATQSGPIYGYFRTTTDWLAQDGKKVAEDTREVTIYALAEGRMLDLSVTMKHKDGPLHFGDTKEGSLGIRVPESMRVKPNSDGAGQGHIVTSAGLKDAATWGKKAEWVDYYGPVDGETLGIAILDDPGNLRHPTTWHVRDYGLFAANPFGLHDFGPGVPAGAGDHTVAAGGAITFKYRIYLHKGTAEEAGIAKLWAASIDPPMVELR